MYTNKLLLNHKLTNGKKWGKETGTILCFSLNGLEILQQERGEVNAIVTKYINSFLFYQSEPANKQYTDQSNNQKS